MLLRLWSLASLGAKPGKTDEPAGARPPPVALSWARCPPSIHDARSPAVILKLSRRTATPSATLSGAERELIRDSRIVRRAEQAIGSRRARHPETRTKRRIQRVPQVVVEAIAA